MKSVKEIMQVLGFRDGASDSVKAAFIQNLIFQAYGIKVEVPVKYKTEDDKKVVQLTFDVDNAG